MSVKRAGATPAGGPPTAAAILRDIGDATRTLSERHREEMREIWESELHILQRLRLLCGALEKAARLLKEEFQDELGA